MNILITGGAGFIGSHLAQKLLQEGHEVHILDKKAPTLAVSSTQGDITDEATVRAAARGRDAIIHLAAVVSVEQLNKDPALAREINVNGSANVITAARENGAKLIAASSAAVYGLNPPIPTREDAPVTPASPYAESKAAMEELISAAGIPHCILRFFNVYGPGQDPLSQYAAVIPTFITHALAGETLTIQGDGEQRRDFIYVDDVTQACTRALTRGSGIINIGTGRSTSIKELAEEIRTLTESTSSISHAPARKGDPQNSQAATERAERELGFNATTTIHAGLTKTIAFFRANAKAGYPSGSQNC